MPRLSNGVSTLWKALYGSVAAQICLVVSLFGSGNLFALWGLYGFLSFSPLPYGSTSGTSLRHRKTPDRKVRNDLGLNKTITR